MKTAKQCDSEARQIAAINLLMITAVVLGFSPLVGIPCIIYGTVSVCFWLRRAAALDAAQ